MASLGRAYGEIVLDPGPAKKGVEEASRHARALEGVIIGVSASITNAFMDAGAAIGRAVAGAVKSSVIMAANLEAQMSGVRAVMGATVEEIAALEDLIIDLGIDPNLQVSTIQAAEAIEMLGRNGLTVTDIMDGAARATVLMANATGAEFSLAADIATNSMALFNIEASDMTEAVNGITSVVTNSKFTVQDYGAALAAGGGVASQVGVDFDDFNASIVAVSAAFGGGSDAGTSFKTMLMRLASPTRESLTEMQRLGLATEDGSIAFYDANGNMREMAEVAGLLNGAISDLSDQQRAAALSTIFGAYGMRFAAQMANYTEEEFRALQETMGNTDAAEAAAIRMDNFRGAMEVLDGVIEAIKIRIGQTLLPVLTRLARAMSEFLERNADKFIAFFEKAAGLIDDVVDAVMSGQSPLDAFLSALAEHGVDESVLQPIRGFVDILRSLVSYFGMVVTEGDALNDWLTHLPDSIQPVVRIIGQFITAVMENGEAVRDILLGIGTGLASFLVITRVTGGIMSFITIVKGISAAVATAGSVLGAIVAFLGGPLTIAIAAIALLIGGFAVAWKNNWFGIRDRMSEVWERIKPIADALRDWLEDAIPQAIGIARRAFDRLSDWWDTNGPAIIDFIRKTFTPLVDRLREVGGAIRDFALKQFDKITTWFEENEPLIRDFIDRVRELASTIGGILAQGLAIAATIFSKVGQAILDLWPVIEPVLGAIVDIILGLGKAVLQLATGDWQGAWETIKETASGIWEGIKEAWGAFKEWVATWIGPLITSIITWFQSVDWAAVGQRILDGIGAALSTGWEIITTVFEGLWSALVEWFNGVDWPALGQRILDGIGNALTAFWEWISPIVEGWWTSLSDWFAGIDWAALGQMVLDAIGNALANFWSTVSGTVEGWHTSLANWFAGVDWYAVGFTVVTAILEALANFWSTVSGTVEGWYTSLSDWFNGVDWYAVGFTVVTAILEAFTSFWDTTSGTVEGWHTSLSDWFDGIDWAELGTRVITAIVGALATFWEAASSTVSGWYTAISEAIDGFSWSTIGTNIVDGIVGGVTGNNSLIGALRSMAQGAWDAVVNFFEERSPSRLAMRTGYHIVEGLALGVKQMTGQAVSATTEMAEQIVSALVGALNNGQDVVNGALAGLLDLAGMFGSVGTAAAGLYQSMIAPRLEKQIDKLNSVVEAEQEMLAGLLLRQGRYAARDDNMLRNTHFQALATGNLELARQVEAVWQTQERMAQGADGLARALGWDRTWVDDQAKLLDAYRKAQASGDRQTERLIRGFMDLKEADRKARETLAKSIGLSEDDLNDPAVLARRYAEAQRRGDREVMDQIQAVLAAQAERNLAEKEYADQLERINKLQEAQANLQFLQQQLDMLNMLAEHGLSVREVLGDIQLGAGADPLAIIEAMTATLDAVAGRVNEQIGSLMGYPLPLPGSDNTYTSSLAAAGQGSAPPAGMQVVIYGGLHLQNVSDPKSLFDQLAALGGI